MNLTIRTAQPNDWEIIQSLNNEVFQNDKDNDPDLILEWPYLEIGIDYYKRLAEGTYGHCLIAELDGKPVGYVALAIKKFDYRKSKYVEVENIGVTKEFRSTGIGEKLIEASMAWAKAQGATKLIVEAFWGNNKAISFYKNNGFIESGIELTKTIQ